jgi:hypothetical protein
MDTHFIYIGLLKSEDLLSILHDAKHTLFIATDLGIGYNKIQKSPQNGQDGRMTVVPCQLRQIKRNSTSFL